MKGMGYAIQQKFSIRRMMDRPAVHSLCYTTHVFVAICGNMPHLITYSGCLLQNGCRNGMDDWKLKIYISRLKDGEYKPTAPPPLRLHLTPSKPHYMAYPFFICCSKRYIFFPKRFKLKKRERELRGGGWGTVLYVVMVWVEVAHSLCHHKLYKIYS